MKLKRSLSQNFLSDQRVARKIVEAAGIGEKDFVVEIGAGAGTLTEELAKTGAKVLAYEIDESLKDLLRDRLSRFENVELVFEDFLEADLSKVPDDFVYVANIPYGITGPIIEKILKVGRFRFAVFMVQKEVAERILSKPGRKSYGYISALVQTYCDVEKLFDVSKSHFVPNPKVDSTVVKLKWRGWIVDFREYSEFLSKVFSKKRKTVKNNLKSLTTNPDGVLKEVGIDPSLRPEDLTPKDLLSIFRALRAIS